MSTRNISIRLFFLILLPFFLFPFLIYSNPKELNLKDKSIYIDLLNLNSRKLINSGDNIGGRYLADKALKLSKENGYKAGNANSLNNLGIIKFNQGDYSNSLEIHLMALKLRNEINDKFGIAGSSNNIGLIYKELGYYEEAFKYFDNCLKAMTDLKDTFGIGISLNNIGLLYKVQGNYPKALEYNFKALRFQEKINDKSGIAKSSNNIGVIYDDLSNYSTAIIYHEKSLQISNQLGEKNKIAGILNDIGSVYFHQGNFSKALDYFNKSINIKEQIGDRSGISKSLGNVGNIYFIREEYNEALYYYKKGLEIQAEIHDKDGLAISYNDIGTIYLKLKKYREARDAFNQSISVAKEIGSYVSLKNGYESLSSLDSICHDYENSLKHFKLFSLYKDSLYNEEVTKKIVQTQLQFDFDKKEASLKAEQERKSLIVQKEIEKQRLLRNSFISGFIFVLFIAFLLYRSRQIKQRTNTELIKKNSVISLQKELVELKNREILDSIEYAKRIQDTMLPSARTIKENLKNSFILYLPKDIVAGDFYWLESNYNEPTLHFAVCDCTGHGVPGAMVSVICHNVHKPVKLTT